MKSYRENPESEENQMACKQAEREKFALKMQHESESNHSETPNTSTQIAMQIVRADRLARIAFNSESDTDPDNELFKSIVSALDGKKRVAELIKDALQAGLEVCEHYERECELGSHAPRLNTLYHRNRLNAALKCVNT